MGTDAVGVDVLAGAPGRLAQERAAKAESRPGTPTMKNAIRQPAQGSRAVPANQSGLVLAIQAAPKTPAA